MQLLRNIKKKLKTKNFFAAVGYYVITKVYIENMLRNVEDD